MLEHSDSAVPVPIATPISVILTISAKCDDFHAWQFHDPMA
jgi:hypothetical protein